MLACCDATIIATASGLELCFSRSRAECVLQRLSAQVQSISRERMGFSETYCPCTPPGMCHQGSWILLLLDASASKGQPAGCKWIKECAISGRFGHCLGIRSRGCSGQRVGRVDDRTWNHHTSLAPTVHTMNIESVANR